jgi:hypothetical protein
LLRRREEMGKEESERTKRFTDDGKLRGIISSAKFVPENVVTEEEGGLGELFRTKEKIDEIDELSVIDEKIGKKRCVEIRDSGQVLDVTGERAAGRNLVVLKVPKHMLERVLNAGHIKKKRRVQFAN